MQRGHYKFAALLILLAGGAHAAAAQRAAHSAPAHAQTANVGLNQNAHRALHRSPSRRSPSGSPYTSPYASLLTSLPFPFFSDFLNSGDIYSSGYPIASQPPPFLMDAAREMDGPATDSIGSAMRQSSGHESSGTQPLMIELQNGRYVNVSTPAINGEALPLNLAERNVAPAKLSGKPSNRAENTDANREAANREVANSRPATLLVFRDGHTEEVRDYTIADGILYARGDFYSDGYWNKKITLASLDLSQTLQTNASRNVKFVLPAFPNEVIVQP